MPRAFCLIRSEPCYRRDAFEAGLRAAGYEVHGALRGGVIRHDDVLVIWNRYGRFARDADAFEQGGARVVVAENGIFGRAWCGEHFYSLALRVPAAVGGEFVAGEAARWDSWGVKNFELRNVGDEVIVLAQRGIGPPGKAQPPGWHLRAAEILRRSTHRKIRIREHPGERQAAVPLEADLARAHCVVTWASGAALKALLMGVPVFNGFSGWCGAAAAAAFGDDIEQPNRRNPLPVLRRIAWSTWTVQEIATGLPFARLLSKSAFTESRTTIAAR